MTTGQLFTDPRVPTLEHDLAEAQDRITRLEAELDRMTDLLEWRTAWADSIDTCGCVCAGTSGPATRPVTSPGTSGAGDAANVPTPGPSTRQDRGQP